MVGRMVDAILHRGPDSDGRFSSSFAEVGFRRLSIIDLSGGDQPLSNEDESVQCFLNGEIYNYLDLKKDLIGKGHRFRTASDTEVLPHLYEEYGTGMFEKLNGMFAICLIDRKLREIFLARDRFGVKQMYLATTPDAIVFGSEVKAVLASGLIKPEVDLSNVLSYLTLFYCPEPYTLVKGVHKLPPGSWARLKAGHEVQIQRYYEVPTSCFREKISEEDAANRTRQLLWQSVRDQLQADVPVGISLSGGIDSSALACAAMQQASSKTSPLALTIHWPDTPPDEVISARELCEQLQMTHEVLEIPLGNVLDELPLLGWISDEPVADPAIYSQFCIARAAARHVKVLLGGAGGDELFGGYGCYGLSRKFAAYNALPQFLQEGLRPFLLKNWMSDDALNAIQNYSRSRFEWHSHTRSNLGSLQQAALSKLIPNSRNPFANIMDAFERYREYDPANQQMIADFKTYLPEQILTMMDRSTMAASIEGRVPFLDNSLVDFAFSLSDPVKMGTPREAKRVLKQAISKDASQLVLQRKKTGMPSPFVSFLSEHVGTLRRIIMDPNSFAGSILPGDWLRGMTANPEVARRNFQVLYAILTLELWHKLFMRDQIYSRPLMTIAELYEIPAKALSA